MSFCVRLPQRGVFEAWRAAARLAISHHIPPDRIDWHGGDSLFGGEALPDRAGGHEARVHPDFIRLAGGVIWHCAPERFGLLYQALWRLDRQDGAPLSQADPLGRKLGLMAKSVGRDIHKMHAFVRFRELPTSSARRSFGAWFEPEHNTLEPGAAFFVKRFADMDWLIATPRLTARFEGGALTFEEGGARPDLAEDASEALWATYFANIFNPARIKLDAMRSEMPKKYWKNLPETRLIPSMLADAEARVERMREAGAGRPRPGAAAVSTRYRATLPAPANLPQTLDEARQAAMQCRRCGLCEAATQTVWGEGDPQAGIMIVGEQAGDREDLAGRPFVGPAGQLLRAVLSDAGLEQYQQKRAAALGLRLRNNKGMDRSCDSGKIRNDVDPRTVWLTNAVKHFKFTPRGKMRLHQTPNRDEIEHCRWWLGLELAFVRPRITLALGASSTFALTENNRPISERRGTIETGLHGGPVLISWHPSHILRTQNPSEQARLQSELAADVATVLTIAAGEDGDGGNQR
jgi:DNA polymerase